MLKSKFLDRARILLFLIAIVVFLASCTLLLNASQMQNEVENQTKKYVKDVTFQLVQGIEYRLSKNITELESVADSLTHIEAEIPGLVEQYLGQKSQMLGFSDIIAVDPENNTYPEGVFDIDVSSLSGIRDSFLGEQGLSVVDGYGILYSVPVLKDNNIEGVLVGIRDMANMQNLIRSDCFSNQGVSYIIDKNGNPLILTDSDLDFGQFYDFFIKNSNKELKKNIQLMEENINNHISGIFRFTAADGSDLILSYDPIASYDWVLLTLVSGDVISREIDIFMNKTNIIIAGVILLFAVILIFLFVSYKQMERNAFVDRVTNGMNDNAFRIKCESVLKKASPGEYAIVFFNIKNFSFINEHFGIVRADMILKSFYDVLIKHLDRRGFASRSNADNFFVCIEDNDREHIKEFVRDVIKDIDDEIYNSCKGIDTLFSFIIQSGVYFVDNPLMNITMIQARTKMACLARTEAEDGICKFYDISITAKMEREQELLGSFASAIENGDFEIYFQPKLWLKSRSVSGAEALVRWNHPRMGLLSPAEFIPLFESN